MAVAVESKPAVAEAQPKQRERIAVIVLIILE
jgi:hypothetical protein